MELLSKLGIDWKLLVAQIINFVVLLGVLYKFLYKPVLKMLQDREEKVAKSLEQAERIEKNLFESEGEKAKIVREARNEAGKIITEAKNDSARLREEITNKTKLETAAILEQGKKQLAFEKELMFKEIKGEVADLVKMAAEKLLQSKMDSDNDRKIIEKSLKEL